MGSKCKSLWRGAFNYRQSARVMYSYAHTERQAWLVFCRRMAKKDGVSPSVVMGLFDGSLPNYEITIEIEFKEETS